VDDKGALRLVRTPAMTAADNHIEQTTLVSVGADGSSRCERTAVFHGQAALSQRDAWMEVPPGERRRLLTSELQDANSRTRLVRLAIDDKRLEDFDQPVLARISFEIADHFSGDSDKEGAVAESKLWGKLLSYNLDYDRTVPLELYAPFELHHRYVITLPPAYHFETVPRERTLRCKWGSFKLSVKADEEEGRRVELEMHGRLDKVRIDAADFEEFRKFHEQLGKDYRVWLTLKPTQELEAVPALEAVLAYAPEDSASAAALVRVYEAHNLSKEAKRVLRRARIYRPNDAALWELTVKLADTLEEEEAAYRELVHRFPDEPKYAVALGTTLVDRGDYGAARKVLEPVAQKGTLPAARALAWFELARGSMHEGDARKALDQLDAAAKADAETLNTVPVWMFRGRVLEKLGRAGDAAESYEQAVKVDAEAEEPLLALVRLNWVAKKSEQALDCLRRYTLAVGDEVEGLATAADWHLRLGRYEDAFELASRAREAGFSAPAQRVLGLVYLHQNKYEEALQHLGKADLDAEVLEGILRCDLAVGRLTDALEQAGQSTKVKDPSPRLGQLVEAVGQLIATRTALLNKVHPPMQKEEACKRAIDHYVCADYGYRDGRAPELVERLLQGAFPEGIDLGPAFGLRGMLSLEKGRLSKALADAERALPLAPEDARGWYVRGRVRLERGNKDALTDLEKAVELSRRQDAAILHWYAVALAQAGRAAEALTVEREAAQRNPNDSDIDAQLRELEKTQSGSTPKGGGSGS
jgi:tetratricopeptide (TPR) repeat protein